MRARTRFLLDLVIACGLIAAYQPGWTGISLHEWVSIAIIVPLAVHLVVNWEWCVRIARTFFQRLFHASRANFVVDSGLLIASVAVMLSGIMVSPIPSWFGLEPTQLLVWSRLHAWSANAIIALFAVHSALHWRWIVATAKRLAPQAPAFARGLAGPSARGAGSARLPGATAAGSLSAAQSRRAARLAAEKAATRRKAGALGVVGVTLALGSLIFASVAVAGPALSGSLSPRGAAVASAVTTRASGRSTASGTASASSTAAATRSAKARTSATVAPVTSAATQVCPRTGCSAITCHGTSGVSAGVWYKTHN